MAQIRTASDATYHMRHAIRSRRRAACIASNLDGPVSVLDVGCNLGITSKFLLDTGAASDVTAIELSAETVSETLKEDPRFRLIEGDVAEVDLDDRFDVCIYGAVHHHVVHYHGLGTAVSVLRKLIASCAHTLFLETGHLSEGGRWYWQPALRRYFRTDEEHLFYLLACIEHAVDDFQIIGRYWIHGIRRWFVKVDLKPQQLRILDLSPSNRVRIRNETTTLARTFGSRGQKLVPSTDVDAKDSPSLFGTAETISGQKVFLKRHIHSPAGGVKEMKMGSQITHDWAVRCMGFFDHAPTLVFPFVQGFNDIRIMLDESSKNRRHVATLLVDLFDEARKTPVHIEKQLLLPSARKLSVLQACDFNPNNLLLVKQDASLVIQVVDFEQQSCRYDSRNRLHLARLLLQLRQHRHRALIEFILGYSGVMSLLIKYQFMPIKRRIQDRQPSLLSALVTECRSVTGLAIRRVLRVFDFE